MCGWTSLNTSTNPSYWTWIQFQTRTINFTGALNPVGNNGKTYQINQPEQVNWVSSLQKLFFQQLMKKDCPLNSSKRMKLKKIMFNNSLILEIY